MELTARITADAELTTLTNERTVINFTVAHNDYYRPKGSTETKKVTEFIRCAYWLNAGLAQYLTKGTLVEISGRIGVNAYVDAKGEAKANLTCHVNTIKLHGGKPKEDSTPSNQEQTSTNKNTKDDLPF